MIKTIAFHILKGGVGKTTITGNIGHCISQKDKKTILIDCDIQANLSNWFIKKDAPRKYELADILQGDVKVKEAILKIRDNLYIIPTKKTQSKLRAYADTKLIEEPFVFDDLNIELDKLGFTYAIYDLAPSMTILERSVLICCGEVITPITAEAFGFEGVELFCEKLLQIKKGYKREIKYNKIILNMINNSFETHTHFSGLVKQIPNYIFYKIGQDRKIADSQRYYETIFEYYPKSKSISEIEKITSDLL